MTKTRIIETQVFSDLDFDCEYNFFYDETNNIRKFYMRDGEFNAPYDLNFILGGICFGKKNFDIEDLFESLRLQSSVRELKFRHLGKGDFASCLNSRKLNTFLSYLNDNEIYVHYYNLNILYYSIVDIVDSAIVNLDYSSQMSRFMIDAMKNTLYKLVRNEIDLVLEVFRDYQYPNIKKERIISFLEDLFSLFEKYEEDMEHHVWLISLKQILKESKKRESLPFLEENENFVLLKDFFGFYRRPIYLFKNSKHFFDNEGALEEDMKDTIIRVDDKIIDNYSFLDSKGHKLVQVSDAFVGFVGKLFEFVSNSSAEGIVEILEGLNSLQVENLKLYFDLIDKSEEKNFAFLCNFTCIDEMEKLRLIYNFIRNS